MGTNIVSGANLVFAYENESAIIKEATFEIKAGDFVFLTGSSGSGKTTFIRSLYGDIHPVSGNLEVCGFVMSKTHGSKLNKLRRQIGVVFQDYKLINEWPIEKNIMLPLIIAGYSKDVCETQVSKLLAHVKLSHKVSKHPKELSGGEQQRVAVARAIAHNPVFMIADEPTGNLDDYSAHVVMELFEMVHKMGTTILIATHKIPTDIKIPYRHLHIENGQLHEIA